MYSHEFLEWMKYHCTTFGEIRNGVFDVYWCLNKDMHSWDNVPSKVYTTEQLHEYWEKNEKKS